MKFLIEFNPPVDVKNNFENSPDIQKKVGEAVERMKPLSAWFTYRYRFFVANSSDELNKKVAPLFHLFKTDPKISPARVFGLDEFPKMVAGLGEEAKKYGY